MLSKSAAKSFFIVGTALSVGAFLLLTVDSVLKVPKQTNAQNLTESVIRGKHLWDVNNCMGCHTLMGEGAYYAPELTKVYDRRGATFIKSMLTDPEAMYPGQRKMVKYDFTEQQKEDMVAFLKWVGEMDLNGFPAEPELNPVKSFAQGIEAPPEIFKQMCTACHSLAGSGGTVGPALDGVGSKYEKDYLETWLKNPQEVKPGTTMPQLPLSAEDLTSLVEFLSNQKNRGE